MNLMTLESKNQIERYTYADYETWDDKLRCELIDGVVYAMSAPSRVHQEVLLNLATILNTFLRGKKCKVFVAPFDVRLNWDTKDDIVLQPDILVVCDEKKIENGKHCLGAPDLVIEILSPSTSRKDLLYKSHYYREYGVKEYWVVDPIDKGVSKLLFGDVNLCGEFTNDSEIPVSVLEGCIINMREVFL